jgi:hypothetical protein
MSHQADFVKTLSIVTAMISTISVSPQQREPSPP